MADVLKDNTIHRRDIRVRIPWLELRKIIERHAIECADLPDVPAEVKIDLKQETEGSPSYAVAKWHVLADISIPLSDG